MAQQSGGGNDGPGFVGKLLRRLLGQPSEGANPRLEQTEETFGWASDLPEDGGKASPGNTDAPNHGGFHGADSQAPVVSAKHGTAEPVVPSERGLNTPAPQTAPTPGHVAPDLTPSPQGGQTPDFAPQQGATPGSVAPDQTPATLGNNQNQNIAPLQGAAPAHVAPVHTNPAHGGGHTTNLAPHQGATTGNVTPGQTPNLPPQQGTPPGNVAPDHTPPTLGNVQTPNLPPQQGTAPGNVAPGHTPPGLGGVQTPNLPPQQVVTPGHIAPGRTPPTLGNDHTPNLAPHIAQVGGTDTGTVTEDKALAAGGKLSIVDPDQGQAAFVGQPSVAGAHGTFTVQPDGTWTYQLDNSQTAVQELGRGEHLNDLLIVSAVDGTRHAVTVEIRGLMDAPGLTVTATEGTDQVTTTAGSSTSATLTTHEDRPVALGIALTLVDKDPTEHLAVSLTIDGLPAGATLNHGHPDLSLRAPAGRWTVFLSDLDKLELTPPKDFTGPITLKIAEAVTASSPGEGIPFALSEATLHINVAPAQDAATIAGVDHGSATEDTLVQAGQLRVGGTLTVTDADRGEAVFTPIAGAAGAGHYGTFTLGVNGHWTYAASDTQIAVQSLGPKDSLTDTLQVSSKDGTVHDITVTITGKNDNPVITTAVRQSDGDTTEDTPAKVQATGSLAATDVDNSGSDLSWKVINGGHGTYGNVTIDPHTGQWTYTLDNSHPETQHLGEGQSITDQVQVGVADPAHGFAMRTLHVVVHGTNDAPVITLERVDTDTGALTEDAGTTSASGHLTATDTDATDTALTWSVDPATASAYGTLSVDGSGRWTYTLDNSRPATQALASGHPVTETLHVIVTDPHGAQATHAITLTLTGAADGALIAGSDSAALTEDTSLTHGQLTASGTLTVTDTDPGEAAFVAVSGAAGASQYGTFTLDAQGHWTYSADNAQTAVQALGANSPALTDTITVTSIDGTTHSLTVTIAGTNDAPVLAVTTAAATEDGTQVTGTLSGTDADNGDHQTYSLGGTAPAGLTLAATGAWTFDPTDTAYQALREGQAQPVQVAVTVTDSAGTATQSTLTITVTGTNDAPKVVGAVTLPGGPEDQTQVITPQQLLGQTTDVDTGDTLHVAGTPTADHGTFSANADGSFTFHPQADYNGAVAVAYQVTDGTAPPVAATATMTLSPVGDPAVITGGTETVTEDQNPVAGKLTTGGVLGITDADTGEAAFTPVTAVGQYGSFALTADGHWTYTADNAQAAVQALRPGSPALTDTLTVSSVDGTTHSLTVTIAGTDDTPVISADVAGAVTEDAISTTHGTLLAVDPDRGDAQIWTISGGGTGTYGSLAIDQHAHTWVYTIDNSNPATNALGGSGPAQGVDTFTVTVTDVAGHSDTETITVHITGHNDAPFFVTAANYQLTEDGRSLVVRLAQTDPDSGNQVTFTAPTEPGFAVTPEGKITVNPTDPAFQSLAEGQSRTITVPITGTDPQGASLTRDLVVTITGTNDHPVVVGAVALPAGTEDHSQVVTLAQLLSNTSDVDAGDHLSLTHAPTADHGVFTTNSDGSFTFLPDANYHGPVAISYEVTDSTGAKAAATATLTLVHDNSVAVITGVDIGTVTEDTGVTGGHLTAGGVLMVTDLDQGEAGFASITGTAGAGQYGTFTVMADGHWTYTADDAQQAIQHLGPTQSLTDTINVASLDGTTHDITVTIHGAIDTPTLGATVASAGSSPGHAKVEVSGSSGHEVLQSTGFVLHSFTFGEAYEGADGALVSLAGRTEQIGLGRTGGAEGFGVGVTQKSSASSTGQETSKQLIETIHDHDTHHHDPEIGEKVVLELQGLSRSTEVVLSDFGGHGDALKWTAYGADGKPVATGTMVADEITNPSNTGLLLIESRTPFAYVAIEATTPPAYVDPHTGTQAQFSTNFGISQVQAELIQFATPLNLQGAIGDTGDPDETLTWRIAGLHQGSLSAGHLNADGSWTVTQAELPGLQVLHGGNQQITVTAIETDTVTGQTAESPPTTLTLDPTGAHYTVITGAPVAVTDEGATTAVTGDLDIDTDLATPPGFVADTQTVPFGTFTIDTDGRWSFIVDRAGTEHLVSATTQSFTVAATDGTARELSVIIQADNDPGILSETSRTPSTGPAHAIGGQLGVTDADNPTTHFMFTVSGERPTAGHAFEVAGHYGNFHLDMTSGSWTYTPDPAKLAQLPAGQTATESFDVNGRTASAGTNTLELQIEVDDQGNARVAQVIHDIGTAQLTEDEHLHGGNLLTNGALIGVDPADPLPVAQVAGTYGTFDVTADGHWTYAADNAQAAIQALGLGAKLTDHVTVTSAGGAAFGLSVTITGADEVAPAHADASDDSQVTDVSIQMSDHHLPSDQDDSQNGVGDDTGPDQPIYQAHGAPDHAAHPDLPTDATPGGADGMMQHYLDAVAFDGPAAHDPGHMSGDMASYLDGIGVDHAEAYATPPVVPPEDLSDAPLGETGSHMPLGDHDLDAGHLVGADTYDTDLQDHLPVPAVEDTHPI